MPQDSAEFAKVAAEARALAEGAGQALSSAHLLLALFTTPNPAELVLKARRVDEETLLARMKEAPREQASVAATLLDKARELAFGTGASAPRALHLLVAIARAKGTTAYELLGACGLNTADLAREALSYVVGPLPRRFFVAEPRAEERREAIRPAAVAFATSPPRVRDSASSTPPPVSTPPVSTPPVSTPPAGKTSVPGRARAAVSVAEPSDPARLSRLSAIRRLAEGLDAEPPPSPFALSPEEFPYLCSIGRNLTELAAAGRIDPVIARDKEIEEALDVLGKRRSNNPVLVGEPGVGKTSVVEGLALRLVELAGEVAEPPARVVVELDVAGLVAGTALRGSLSEKLTALKDEVRRAAGRVVVFIDEIHTLVGAGQTGEGAQDAANELKSALARGEFPCIGATTFTEFQRYFAQDPALERRFVPIHVREPSIAQASEILRGIAPRYAAHHGVEFDDEALESAALLSARYVRDRSLPDKAVAVLDQAGSRTRREGRTRVERADVARVVARMAHLPEERLLVTDAERVLKLEDELGARVVGHREVVKRVAAAVRRSFGGFSGVRPMASFIFLGPTGVGKTELARSLAEVVFGSEDALVRVDMSEFSESHSVAKLVGAPPGYVGYGEGGQLTDGVRRRPACVVLLDEIEKAHRETQQLVLQLLDEGHLTDGRGRRVDFSSTVVVLTSNLGAEAFARRRERAVGFGAREGEAQEDRAGRALASAREGFPPELWNRIEERLVFGPLGRDDLHRIALLLGNRSSTRLTGEKGISFELDASAIDHLLDHGGFDAELGARPMRQALQRLVEAPLAEKILRGELLPRDRVRVLTRGGKLHFEALTIVDPKYARP
jgi:ATP-dependent Clp protease ATP-binding subunit ClpC